MPHRGLFQRQPALGFSFHAAVRYAGTSPSNVLA